MKKLVTMFLVVLLLMPFFAFVLKAKATSEAEWMVIPPSYTKVYDSDGDGNLDSHKLQIEADTDHDTGSGSITVYAKGQMYDRFDNTPLTSWIQVNWQIRAPGHVNQEEYSPEMVFNVPKGYTSKEGLSYIRTKTLIYLYDDEWHLEQNGDYQYAPWDIRHNLYPPSNSPQPYDVTINAHCEFEGVDISVAVTTDGTPTGYSTPHTFIGLTGTHNFTIPNTDSKSHPFKQWSNGQTETTIKLASAETVTAYYIGIMDFEISVDPSFSTVGQGQSTTATVKTTPIDQYPYVISLSSSGEPPGITITFDPSRRTCKYTSTMTVQVESYVPERTYPITITATGEDSKVHSTSYTLTVGTSVVAGEITDVRFPSRDPNPAYSRKEIVEIWVDVYNPTSTEWHYLVAVNIFGPSMGDPIYDSHKVGADRDALVPGHSSAYLGPFLYIILADAPTGTYHVLAGLRLYPWDPELHYRGLSWCPPEETFVVKGLPSILFEPPFAEHHDSTNLVNKQGLAYIEVSSKSYESGKGQATTNVVTAFYGGGMVLAQFSFSDKWTCPNSGDYEIRLRSEISGQVQLTNIGAMFGDAAARGETWIVAAVEDETSHSLVLDDWFPLLSAADPNYSLEQQLAQSIALDIAEAVAGLYMQSSILSKAVTAIQLGSSLIQLLVPLTDKFDACYEMIGRLTGLKAGNVYRWFFMVYTSSFAAALWTHEASSQSTLIVNLDNVEVLPLSVDSKPPTTELTSIPPEIISSGDVTFAWVGSDDITRSDELLYAHWLVGFDEGWSSWSRSTSWQYGNLPDGSYVFHVRAVDTSGNVDSIGAKSYFLVDTTPPTGSIVINSGAAYTTSTSVTLGLSASDSGSGIAQMMVSNDPSFSGASWKDYATSKPWTLASRDGTKTVYVKYKDNIDLESLTFSDTIILDTTAPLAFIDDIHPSPVEKGQTVYFRGHGTDSYGAIVEYRWESSIDGFLSDSSSFSTSSLTIGTHTLYFKVKDDDGAWSDPDTRTLTVNSPVSTLTVWSGRPEAKAVIGTDNQYAVSIGNPAQLSFVTSANLYAGADSAVCGIGSSTVSVLEGYLASKDFSGSPLVFGWWGTGPNENFVAYFYGSFLASQDGTYGFRTESDDGSIIFIDDVLVVNNYYQQGATQRDGKILLQQGAHYIFVKFEEGFQPWAFKLQWQPPNQQWLDMPVTGKAWVYYSDYARWNGNPNGDFSQVHPIWKTQKLSTSETWTLTWSEYVVPEQSNTIKSIKDKIVNAADSEVYFIQTRNAYDSQGNGYVYATCINRQNLRLMDDPIVVRQEGPDLGRPLFSNSFIVLFGGDAANLCAYYYTRTMQTPLLPTTTAYGYSKWGVITADGTIIPNAWIETKDLNGHKDLFIIETLIDSDGNFVAIMCGWTQWGTLAAGPYFCNKILPNIDKFVGTWCIYVWEDGTNGQPFDSFPQPEEVRQVACDGNIQINSDKSSTQPLVIMNREITQYDEDNLSLIIWTTDQKRFAHALNIKVEPTKSSGIPHFCC